MSKLFILEKQVAKPAFKALTTGFMSAVLLFAPVAAQAQSGEPVVRSEKVAGNIYVLYGRGGNIGVSVGAEGVFLIDDQFAPLSGEITERVAELSDKKIKFIINTHFHGDHTGGNENFGKAGTVIIAHDNVRQRMAAGSLVKAFNMETNPQETPALPVVTFDHELSLHLNGEEARAAHVPHAHTDSDSFIHFKGSNVIHMGDLFFASGYPFIDTSNGGHVDGVISGVKKALELADAETKIIPGHGAVTDKAGLTKYLGMLEIVRERVHTQIKAGKSREDIVSEAILDGLDYGPLDAWALKFVGFVHDSFK